MSQWLDEWKSIYKMKLGDIRLPNSNSIIIRVPGGWVYGSMQGEVFIPFNNEFMETNKNAQNQM